MKITKRMKVLMLFSVYLPATLVLAQGEAPEHDLPESAVSVVDETIFSPLPVPHPDERRTAQGAPGPAYWQQKADYYIRASLDPVSHRITGTVRITYTNNSPHHLDQLWIQLDQNAFSPESRSTLLQGPASRWGGSFDEGGIAISNLSVSRLGQHTTPEYSITDTRMRIPLDSPLPPDGTTIDISMDFSFLAPESGADRMGRMEVENGTIYQIAQWYPRMHVYDDISGWNTMPYLGQGEFYLEYGDFYVEISTPADFVVVATGELLNPEDVYTEEQVERLEQARSGGGIVPIIAKQEAGSYESRPNYSDSLTWIFQAQQVRDFAWAASQAFILDAASWEDILVMSAYPHEAIGTETDPGWERSMDYLLHSIRFYSDMWHQYPYPVAINVAGNVNGMGYPMLFFCSLNARSQSLFSITDHETAHSWFPMLVGSHERRHAWMDEGFTAFMSYYSIQAYLGDAAEHLQYYDPDFIADRMADRADEQSIMTYPDQISPRNMGFLTYRKPGVGLHLLREYVLGPSRFDTAFMSYINRWAFKHPHPADFFRTMEQISGEDLAWFWRGWFYGTEPLDQQISPAASSQNGLHFTIGHLSSLLFPVDLLIEYSDGTIERKWIPVETFFHQPAASIELPDTSSVEQLVVDPDHRLPDVDRSNNVWTH